MSEFPGRFPHEPESGFVADPKPKSEKDSKSKKGKSKSRDGSSLPKLPEISHQNRSQPAERVQNFGKLFVEQSPSVLSESPRGQKKKEGRPKEESKAEDHPTVAADEPTPAAERSQERPKDEPEPAGKPDAAERGSHTRHKNESSGEAERSEEDVARWSAENLLPLDAAYGAAEVIIYDAKPNTEKAHDDTAVRVEPAEESGVSSETEPKPILLPVPPHSGRSGEYSAARVHETPPPSEAPVLAAGAADGGEKPPSGGTPGAEAGMPFEQVPDPLMVPVAETGRPEPAEAYRQYMEREAVQQHPAGSGNTLPSEPMVTKREAEDDAYYAAKAAQSRGFVTGLLVAGLWARHRGKKLRRQFNQRFKKQEKQLEQVREDQHFYFTEQTKQQATNERQLTAAQNRFESAEKRLEVRGRPAGQAELHQLAADQHPESPQQFEGEAERLLVPAGHKLQRSEWLTTEIDRRTGRPVEQPAFTYGHEYYRERAQEATPTAQRNAAAGEIALVAAAAASLQAASGNDNAQSGGTDPSSAHIPLATTQGPPPSASRQKTGSTRDLLSRSTSAGPIWPYLLALVVIFVCLAFLLL